MKKNTFIIALLLIVFSTSVFSKTVTITPSGADDSGQIQTALNSLVSGDIIQLNGNFKLKNTIYLPSNIKWILSGTLTLISGGTFANIGWTGTVNGVAISAKKSTAIAEKNWDTTGATGIEMSGGTYDGNYVLDQNAKAIRMIQFARVRNSNFHDMIMKKASDDIFSLSTGCSYNVCSNLLASYAGLPDMSFTGNGLNDKGDHNKWYDCIAEYCTSDAWTPKCRFSEFYRCIGRFSQGPGWGMYCRMDGSPTTQDVGEVIEGNKWFDCVANGNSKGGFAFDVSVNSGPGAKIINNYIQVKSFDNQESGVKFRSKVSGAIVDNNEIDLLCYNNQGLNNVGVLIATNGGLGTEDDTNAPITNIYGKMVAYGNGNADVNTARATGSAINVYRPTDQNTPVLKKGSTTNIVTVTDYNCTQTLPTWCQQKYCSEVLYALTITSGTGGGSYTTGTVVNIVANSPPTGKVFDKWVINSGSPTIANINNASTTLTMSTAAAAITATYKNISVTGVTVTPATATLTIGNTQQLTATVAPSNATNKKFNWTCNCHCCRNSNHYLHYPRWKQNS